MVVIGNSLVEERVSDLDFAMCRSADECRRLQQDMIHRVMQRTEEIRQTAIDVEFSTPVKEISK